MEFDPVPPLKEYINELELKLRGVRQRWSALTMETYREVTKANNAEHNAKKDAYRWRQRANKYEVLLRKMGIDIAASVAGGPMCPSDEIVYESDEDIERFNAKRPKRQEAIDAFEEGLAAMSNDLWCTVSQSSNLPVSFGES